MFESKKYFWMLCGFLGWTITHIALAQSPRTHSARAELSLKDLKALLTDQQTPKSEILLREAYVPTFQLNRRDTQKLLNVVQQLENQRSKLIDETEIALRKESEKLAAQRHEIQLKRAAASREEDIKLARELYNNLLLEANLKARRNQSIGEFDRKNAVVVFFNEVDGIRTIESISLGPNEIWSARSVVARQ